MWKWLQAWFWKVLSFFGFRRKSKANNLSVIPSMPKQLSSGTSTAISGEIVLDDASQQSLRELAADIAKRETALESNLLQAQIEALAAENRAREREVEAKAANDVRVAKHREEQIALRAEEMRREQERLDETARAEAERLKFEAEQEQFRKNTEQHFRQQQKKAKQQQEDRAKKQQRTAERRKKNRQSRREYLAKVSVWLSQHMLNKKLAMRLVMAVIAAAIIVGIYHYQLHIIGLLSAGFNQVTSWLNQYWRYLAGAVLAASLAWFMFSARFQAARENAANKLAAFGDSVNAFVEQLSIVMSIVVAGLLFLIACVGMYFGSVLLALAPIGFLPLCFSWKPGYGLSLRLVLVFFWQGIVIALSQVRLQ